MTGQNLPSEQPPEGELAPAATVKQYVTVQTEGNRQAKEKAELELEDFRQKLASLPQPVDDHFSQTLDELKRIEEEKKEKPRMNTNGHEFLHPNIRVDSCPFVVNY